MCGISTDTTHQPNAGPFSKSKQGWCILAPVAETGEDDTASCILHTRGGKLGHYFSNGSCALRWASGQKQNICRPNVNIEK